MRMADVRVGMVLRSTVGDINPVVEVTEIIDRGFRYRIPDHLPVRSPHWSMRVLRDGHEHYCRGDQVSYEPA